MEKLWTASEVARVLGITELDVERLVREGKLTGYKLGGKFLRFRPQQVDELKGKLRFRATPKNRPGFSTGSWFSQANDFLYFYDFYVLSAVLFAMLVVYLIAST